MTTGVQRIVTISCTDSDDARWRRPLAQGSGKTGAGSIMTWFAKSRGVESTHATSGVTRLAQVAADWEKPFQIETADAGGRLLALLTRASGPLEKAHTLERMRYDR